MTFELAISTMNKSENEIFMMIKDMNLRCDCVVVNQCNDNKDYYVNINNNQQIHIICTTERGLSRSRNLAIKKSKADIVGIADDDLYYYDGFEEIILDYYQNNESADIVIFNIDNWEKSFSEKTHKCNFFELSGFVSMQITIKKSSIYTKFNELFGSGSKVFDSGEENIFLAQCYRRKKSIYYCNKKILNRTEKQSSWFKGYNNEKFISDRGAIYYEISPILFPIYIFRFAFFKRKIIKPISSFYALKLMIEGKNELIYRKKRDFHSKIL